MAFSKHDEHKPRFSLIPPEAILSEAQVFTHGANKYGAYNWEEGCAWTRYFDAAMRHLLAWRAGEDMDEDSGLRHLAHARASIAILHAMQKREIGEDDR